MSFQRFRAEYWPETRLNKAAICIATVPIFSTLITGCGGGGGGGGGSQANGRFVTGSLASHLRRDGTMVSTVFQAHVTPNSDGSFAIDASIDRPQVVIVHDRDGNPLAAALADPAETSLPTIGETSTAKVICALTAGVASSYSAELRQRLRQIESLPSFARLVAEIEAQRGSRSLEQQLNSSGVQQALIATIEDWKANHGDKGRDIIIDPRSGAGIEFSVLNQAPIASVGIRMQNSAWRRVQVDRQDLRSESVFRTLPIESALSGATSVSFGSIFTGTLFDAAEPKDDRLDLSTATGGSQSVYWLHGLGLGAGETLPSEIANTWNDESWTVFEYAALPALDLITGLNLQSLLTSAEKAQQVAKLLATPSFVSTLSGLVGDVRSGTVMPALAKTIDLIQIIVSTIPDVVQWDALLLRAGIKGIALALLKKVIAALSLLITGANCYMFVSHMVTVPAVSKVTVDATGDVEVHVK